MENSKEDKKVVLKSWATYFDEMPKIDKNAVRKDWLTAFPILSKYSPCRLYYMADIMYMGVDINYARCGWPSYHADFMVWSLWQIYPKYDTYASLLMQINSTRSSKQDTFEEAKNKMQLHYGGILQARVSVKQFLIIIYQRWTRYYYDSRTQSCLCAMLLAIGTYFGNEKLMIAAKKFTERVSRKWNQDDFKALFKCTIDEWKEYIYALMEDRDRFMAQVERFAEKERMYKVNKAHLDMDLTDKDIRYLANVAGRKGIGKFLARIFV